MASNGNEIDRSQYRNPDMPVGYVSPNPSIAYTVGEVIDGTHYIWARLLYEINIENQPDYARYQNFDFLSSSEDEDEDKEESKKTEKKDSADIEQGMIDSADIEQGMIDSADLEKGIMPDDDIRRKYVRENSSLEDFLSKMEIFPEKEDKKKTIKIKKECRSDSKSPRRKSSPPSRYRSFSPDCEIVSSFEDFQDEMEVDPEKGAKKKIKKAKKKHRSGSKERKSGSKECRSGSKSPAHKSSPQSRSRRFSSEYEFDEYLRSMEIDPETGAKIKIKKERRSPSPQRSPEPRYRRSSPDHKDRDLVAYSRSPTPENFRDVKIKKEPEPHSEKPIKKESYDNVQIKKEGGEKPQHLFGSYHCEVCNITMNSFQIYNAHIIGKRHLKAERLRNIADAERKNIQVFTVPDEGDTKYPKPKPNFVRRKVNCQAVIQKLVDRSVFKPCPGLSEVIEIQGIGQFVYYCSVCDAVCNSDSLIPHLNGHKHQMHLLKHFKPAIFDRLSPEPRYKIDNEVKSILSGLEKTLGRGYISVEVEEFKKASEETKDSQSQPDTSQPSTSYQSQPSTSKGTGNDRPASSFHERFKFSTELDSKSSDFVCHLCQSHMNSQHMFEAHMKGKRHLANVKKLPGDKPSKTKTVHVPNKRAYLLDRIKKEMPDEPIIGLQEIRETEILERNSHNYQCFLCGSCHTDSDILEHLISYKHRYKYLEHIDFPELSVTYSLSESMASPLLRDMCAQVQAKDGTGNPEVHVNKTLR